MTYFTYSPILTVAKDNLGNYVTIGDTVKL